MRAVVHGAAKHALALALAFALEIRRSRREGDFVAPISQRCDDGGRVRRVRAKNFKRNGIRINGKHHLRTRLESPTCHASQAREQVYYAHSVK